MGKYSWKDAKEWKELYEELHDFIAVEKYIKENIDPEGPYESTIRTYVKKYLKQLLQGDYNEWLEKFHEAKPYKYTEENYQNWKDLYEKLGTFESVRNEIEIEANQTPPDYATIRKGLKSILKDKYEDWKTDFSKELFDKEEIEDWKRIYEKYGSIGKLSNITGHDPKVLKKHLKSLLGNKYDAWYKKFYIHHSIKYRESEIIEWKSLFEELGSFPAVSERIQVIFGQLVSPSVIRKTVKKYLESKKIDYSNWLNDFSLSDIIVDIGKKIHQVIEYYFMMNFKETDIPVFYEITPSTQKDDLFRVDNSYFIQESLRKDKFQIINIDYVFSANIRRLYPKMYKNYHSKKMLLLIVPLIGKLKSYSIPLDVKDKASIKIINLDNYMKMFNFNDNFKNKIGNALNIAKKAPYSLNAYTELKNLASLADKKMKVKFGSRRIQQIYYNKKLKNIQSKN